MCIVRFKDLLLCPSSASDLVQWCSGSSGATVVLRGKYTWLTGGWSEEKEPEPEPKERRPCRELGTV